MSTFEYIEVIITSGNIPVRILLVYRLDCDAKKKKISNYLFLMEFSTVMNVLSVAPVEIVVIGDLNFHVNDPDDADVQELLEYLSRYDLLNHVQEPTH